MDAELVVIGAGFWGTAIALALRNRGRHVVCLDSGSPEAGSRAAGGLMEPGGLDRPAFLERLAPDWWSPRHRQACLDFLLDWARECGQDLYHRTRPEPSFRAGLWRADCELLLKQAVPQEASVDRLEPCSGGWRAHTSGGFFSAPWVVVAAGYASDALLRESGLSELGILPLKGRGLFFRAQGNQERPLTLAYRLLGESRTRKATASPWAHLLRAGDTVESVDEDLPAQLAAIHEVARRAGGLEQVGETVGIRPVLPRLFVDTVAPGLIVATGGRRNGLVTAAGAALRVCELLPGQEKWPLQRK